MHNLAPVPGSFAFGQIDSTSTSTTFTATVPNVAALYDGLCVYLKNGTVNSASGWTLNVNSLGAKPVYKVTAASSRVTTEFKSGTTMLFVYNSSRVSGGCWDMIFWTSESSAETDPVFLASPAGGITNSDISNWNNKLSAETDPVFAASPAHGITSSDISNWNGKTSNIGTVTSVNDISPDSSGNVELDAEDVNAVKLHRIKATLSSTGWYRVLAYKSGASGMIDFTICVPRSGTDSESESHKITYFFAGGVAPEFGDESSLGNTLLIDKIRRSYGETIGSDAVSVFDIHYVGSTAKTVYVDYILHGDVTEPNKIIDLALAPVADAPSGSDGIFPSYDFLDRSISQNRKTLWTGSWASGTINVPGLNKYSIFVVNMDGQGTQIIVPSIPGVSYFRGVGGYASGSSANATYFLGANRSGEDLTMVSCHSQNQSGTRTARTVTSIIGIV